MENLPFDLSHTIYINILRNLRGLGGLGDIYYVALMIKILWVQGVYHVFDWMNKDSKHTIIVKGLVVAKQHKFNKTNFKAMKVVVNKSLKKVPQVDEETINRRKQKRLAKAITDEDKSLLSFSIAKKIYKRMGEQQKKTQTRK